MALQKVSPGLLPAENFIRFGRAFDAIDGQGIRLDALDAFADTTRSRLASQDQVNGQLDARLDAQDDLNPLVDARIGGAERAIGAALDQINATEADVQTLQGAARGLRSDLDGLAAREDTRRPEFVSPMGRPGDGPLRYCQTTSLSALGGLLLALPQIAADALTFADAGAVVRLRGAGIIATRAAYPVEPGRAYATRYAYQRRANPSDPSNDSVRSLVVWLDQAGNLLPGGAAVKVIEDNQSLLVVSGRQEVGTTVSRSPGGGLITAPEAARYARLALQSFGPDGLTDIEVIDWADVTDATLLDPVSADTTARVATIESQNLGPRISAIEGQLSAPNSIGYGTRSDAQSATIPNGVTTLTLRGWGSPGDGLGGLFSRVGSLAPGADGFTSRDGAIWQRVIVGQEIFNALMDRWLGAYIAGLPRSPDGLGANRPWVQGDPSSGYLLTVTGTNT